MLKALAARRALTAASGTTGTALLRLATLPASPVASDPGAAAGVAPALAGAPPRPRQGLGAGSPATATDAPPQVAGESAAAGKDVPARMVHHACPRGQGEGPGPTSRTGGGPMGGCGLSADEPGAARVRTRLAALLAALCLHAGLAVGLTGFVASPVPRGGDARAVTLVVLREPDPPALPAPATVAPEVASAPAPGEPQVPEPEPAPSAQALAAPPAAVPPVEPPPPPAVARSVPARAAPRARPPKPARPPRDPVAAQGRGGASERPASPAPTGAGLAGPDPGADRPAVPDRPAAYLSNPRPRYPELARRRRLEGLVVLEVLVDPAGGPERVTVNRSSGHEVLDSGAVEVVKRWRFAPARRGGQAVAARVQVPVRFALTDH